MSLTLLLLTLTTWQCSKDNFNGEIVGICPKVTLTNPVNGANNVVNTKQITATFNKAMDATTINETSFILRKGVNLISGTVDYNGTTATFSPTDLLEANSVYVATIKRSSKDLLGTMMPRDTTWSFNTGVNPVVILTDPIDGASNVSLDKLITANFSTEMDNTTINTTSFVVMQGITAIPGAISYLGNNTTFTPTTALLQNKVYSATIKKEVTDAEGNSMTKDTTWSFATGTVFTPIVVSTNPIDGAEDVATNIKIKATFSKAMDNTTINSLSYKLMNGTTPVAGTVTYANYEGIFTPTSPLLNGTTYDATITTDATDLDGNPLANNKQWSFTTLSGINPVVILTDPIDGASNVSLDKLITANFSMAMDNTTINTTSFVVMQGVTAVPGAISYLGNKATFTPTTALLQNKVYSATIKKEVTDAEGHLMKKDTMWSFATKIVIPPVVVATNPIDGTEDVATDIKIRATFSKAMDNTTINSLSYKLMNGTIPVAGTVTYANNEGLFTPTSPLLNGITYDATITTDATDLDGNPLANEKQWSFTTQSPINQYTVALSANLVEAGSISGAGLFNDGASVTVLAITNPGFIFSNWTESGTSVSTSASYNFTINSDRTLVANFTAIIAGPPGVALGSAGDFAILAGAGISNTGVSTIITGDAGSFPTSTINGISSANVVGILYTVADPIVGQAKDDLTTAYNDAQGRSTSAISLPGQLGGLTMVPGLYVNSSTSGISGTGANGILTLDAGGNPNAVWIFKMGSTLITDSGTSIVLAGGAQAKNIYWSVGSSATLGTNSIFYGNILADQSITLTTGATLTGRALTRIGSVTLDTSTITKP